MKRCPVIVLISVIASLSALFTPVLRAQLPPPEEKPALGARMPALSTDGKKLAFVWRGDIWVSDAGGGRAYPVTDHVELDAYPVFSPDAKWLAFSSVRNGNWDIFVVPASGGAVRQMTFSSGQEVVTDWSPDGKTLLFTGLRDTVNNTLFALDVATLRFRKLTEDYKSITNAQYAPDGRRIVFGRYGFPWTRPRYTGSAAMQAWTLDLTSGKREAVTKNDSQMSASQNLWPRWLPDGKSVITVTVGEATPNAEWLGKPLPRLVDNARRTPNLWMLTPGAKPRQLTTFVGDSVRHPAVARRTGDIVFEYGHDLYRLAADGKTPEKLLLYCGSEDKINSTSREVLTGGVDEAEISPDGKTFAFGLRGEIWTIPVEKPKTRNADDAARLTEHPGFDRDFNWSADGKSLFFVSDRDGNNRVFAVDVDTRAVRPVWTGATDASSPKVSPDGKLVGFWVAGSVEGAGGLYVKPTAPDRAGVAPRRIVALPRQAQGDWDWSPDMKWIAYTRRNVESDGWNLWIAPAGDGRSAEGSGKAVNVTRLNAWHGMPRWSPDGKYLFFASNRDAGTSGRSAGTSGAGNGLYVLPLKPEEARADELEIKWEKPKGPVTVEIDWEDTPQRIRRVTTQNPEADLSITGEGQIFFVSEGDAWSCSYDGKEVKRLTTGGGVRNLRAAADGKTLFFYKNGGLFTLKPASNNAVASVTFSAPFTRDIAAERRAAFNEFWRSYNTRFYSGSFHGRDWAAIRKRYEPLLESVGTRDEFATLLNRMVGELEASHTEVGAAPGPTGPQTRYLGVYFDYDYAGPGIRVRDVPRRAPGSYEKTRIKPGEYIIAVDGKDVTLDENLFKVLNDKGDKDFELLVNGEPTRKGARTVKFKALTWAEWTDLHYRNRIERLRRTVEQKSQGRIGYVHIAGMGGPNQVQFDRELYEYAEGKDAVIIDVRFNGGGNISDTLINWLGIKPYGTYLPRDGYPQPAPSRGWKKPVVVLMNEHSYSNAEMFPYAMRAHGLARLVGMPTPGYVIWTWGMALVDGTNARMPGSGVYRADGSPMENLGEKPDVQVPLSTEDWLAERDPQLDRAIELLTKK